jgi:hypothetical protein
MGRAVRLTGRICPSPSCDGVQSAFRDGSPSTSRGSLRVEQPGRLPAAMGMSRGVARLGRGTIRSRRSSPANWSKVEREWARTADGQQEPGIVLQPIDFRITPAVRYLHQQTLPVRSRRISIDDGGYIVVNRRITLRSERIPSGVTFCRTVKPSTAKVFYLFASTWRAAAAQGWSVLSSTPFFLRKSTWPAIGEAGSKVRQAAERQRGSVAGGTGYRRLLGRPDQHISHPATSGPGKRGKSYVRTLRGKMNCDSFVIVLYACSCS